MIDTGKPVTVRCFGGPLHDEVVTVDRWMFLAPERRPRSSYYLSEDPDPTEPAFNIVRYDVERIALHDEHACAFMEVPARTRDALCSDRCRLVYLFALVEGGNPQPVTDTVIGLYWLTLASIGRRWS